MPSFQECSEDEFGRMYFSGRFPAIETARGSQKIVWYFHEYQSVYQLCLFYRIGTSIVYRRTIRTFHSIVNISQISMNKSRSVCQWFVIVSVIFITMTDRSIKVVIIYDYFFKIFLVQIMYISLPRRRCGIEVSLVEIYAYIPSKIKIGLYKIN